MAERLRQLLDALDVSTQLLMDGQPSGDLKTIARQLMDVLKNTLVRHVCIRYVCRDILMCTHVCSVGACIYALSSSSDGVA
eukprot:31539-Eustigmatos_ZCMA.PRE.1